MQPPTPRYCQEGVSWTVYIRTALTTGAPLLRHIMHDARMSGTVPQQRRQSYSITASAPNIHSHCTPTTTLRNQATNAWPHTPTGVGGSVVSHKKWVTRLLHGIIWPSPRFNPAMEGVVSVYQIVTIAF
jgi:hypothetical protein